MQRRDLESILSERSSRFAASANMLKGDINNAKNSKVKEKCLLVAVDLKTDHKNHGLSEGFE